MAKPKKNPWLAGVMSFLLPGAGQVYKKVSKERIKAEMNDARWNGIFYGLGGMGFISIGVVMLSSSYATEGARIIGWAVIAIGIISLLIGTHYEIRYTEWKEKL